MNLFTLSLQEGAFTTFSKNCSLTFTASLVTPKHSKDRHSRAFSIHSNHDYLGQWWIHHFITWLLPDCGNIRQLLHSLKEPLKHIFSRPQSPPSQSALCKSNQSVSRKARVGGAHQVRHSYTSEAPQWKLQVEQWWPPTNTSSTTDTWLLSHGSNAGSADPSAAAVGLRD